MAGAAEITGSGRLADELRRLAPATEHATTVIVAAIEAEPKPFDELTDADFDLAWEQPMRSVIGAFQDAHRAGHSRVVAIVPTIGMSGAPGMAPSAATAEAVRVLVKSAARQWGEDGITVNCVAVAPAEFGIDPAAVGTVSLAPPALAGRQGMADLVAIIEWLGSEAAGGLTGATLTADGGVWMSP